MKKIYYNENGWVCERFPYDIEITDDKRFLEVEDDIYVQTLHCETGKSWKVVDGELILEIYDNTEYTKNKNIKQICELKQQLADMGYKTSKYADGEYTDEEWQAIVAERKAIREKIRELEKLI